MQQYFDLIMADQPNVEDDIYVLTTNEEIYIQVLQDGSFFVHNGVEEVSPASTLKEAMTIAIATQVIEEFATVFQGA